MYLPRMKLVEPLITKKKQRISVAVVLTFALFLFVQPSFGQDDAIAPWKLRLGKLRADLLEEIFPRVKGFWERVDPIGISFIDYRDPLEAISLITLYLPGVVFMFLTLFHCVPHILNFFLFLPKMWFYGVPCLYEYSQSWFKRRKRRRSIINEGRASACNSVRLSYINSQVHESLIKMIANN